MIEILKDWGDLLAVFKPAGWLTVPGRGNKQDVPILSERLGDFLRKGAPRTKNDLYVIHRLDEGTSGIVLFARTAATHKEYSLKFENGEIKKTYRCLIEGEIENQIVDQPLLKLPGKKNKSVVSPKGKSSQTIFKKLKVLEIAGEKFSIIEAIPLTGRTHQIRVHLQFLKHPIVGDKLYGGKIFLDGRGVLYPILHASQLEFTNSEGHQIVSCPVTGLLSENGTSNK